MYKVNTIFGLQFRNPNNCYMYILKGNLYVIFGGIKDEIINIHVINIYIILISQVGYLDSERKNKLLNGFFMTVSESNFYVRLIMKFSPHDPSSIFFTFYI